MNTIGHRRPTSRPAAWLIVLVTAVLWPLAPASSTRAAAPIPLSAYGTATIDGWEPYGEWDGAARMTIPVLLPYPTNPIKAPAEFLVMNDADNLYLALRVGRTLDYAGLSVEFDTDDDGIFMEEGDDGVGASGGRGDSRFVDFARIRCSTGDYGDRAACAPEDTHTDQLYPVPGTIDGGSGSSQPFGTDFIELFHPLDSADDARDFSLGPGSTVGFEVHMRMLRLVPIVRPPRPPAEWNVGPARPPRTVWASIMTIVGSMCARRLERMSRVIRDIARAHTPFARRALPTEAPPRRQPISASSPGSTTG